MVSNFSYSFRIQHAIGMSSYCFANGFFLNVCCAACCLNTVTKTWLDRICCLLSAVCIAFRGSEIPHSLWKNSITSAWHALIDGHLSVLPWNRHLLSAELVCRSQCFTTCYDNRDTCLMLALPVVERAVGCGYRAGRIATAVTPALLVGIPAALLGSAGNWQLPPQGLSMLCPNICNV